MENLRLEILELLTKKLGDKFVYSVTEHRQAFGAGQFLKIWIACSDHDINGVRGQKPQVVSLMLEDTMELHPQIFGGNGGRCIYREPNKEVREEQYLAMKGVKLPFRTPKPEVDKVKEAIAKFVDNYIKTLKENRATLLYQNIVNYDNILN